MTKSLVLPGEQEETAVLVMSDIHYGKQTASFDPDVCKSRLVRVSNTLDRIRTLLPEYSFDKIKLCVLGDLTDGTGIYPTQDHHQAESNAEQQADEASNVLLDFGLRIKGQGWGDVEYELVPGNHGRSSKFAHEGSNFDLIAYRYLKLKLGDQLAVNMPESGDLFIKKLVIRKHGYLLYHGHDIKTYGNIPWYGMQLRTFRWATSGLAPFDVVMMGHFHSFGMWQLNDIQLMLTGTIVTGDDWALRTFGWEGTNKWWLFGVSNKYPITWSFGINLA